jgi:hypothetical protein
VSDTTTITAPSLVETVPVGTIFASSWGWEQTNVSFYEVVGHTGSGKSVRLRKIARESVGPAGFMSDHVKPVPGHFIGETFTKRLLPGSTRSPERNAAIKLSYSEYAWVTDPAKSHYVSWYA